MLKPANEPGYDYKRLVREGYDRCSEAYGQSRGDPPGPELQSLISVLGDHPAILDIGCGNGIPVTRELARVNRITGVDISPVQIGLARRNVPEGHFLRGDIMEMAFPDAGFDAVVSYYAIFHLPKEEHRVLFGRIHRWLKPGGYLLASVTLTNEDPYTEDDFYGVTMYWSNYGLAEYRRMLLDAGFALLEAESQGQGRTQKANPDRDVHPILFGRKPEIG